MGIAKKETGESRDFWKAAESLVRDIQQWPDYKKEIIISSQGSGFIDSGSSNSNYKDRDNTRCVE
jgi:hypothetical protein